MNKIIISGNLGNPPTPVGDGNIAKLSVATSKRWTDKKTGEKMEKTTWHNCDCFGHNANYALQYLQKGSKVLIEGSYESNNWTDKDGNQRSQMVINVERIESLSYNDGNNNQNGNQNNSYNNQNNGYNNNQNNGYNNNQGNTTYQRNDSDNYPKPQPQNFNQMPPSGDLQDGDMPF